MKLGHIGIPVKDLEKSKAFYDTIIEHIDLEFLDETETSVRYGKDGSVDVYIHTRNKPVTNVHLCFELDSQDSVDAFYASALVAGGADNGAPGIREDYSPTYYAAFVFDPDGNNIEVVYR